MDAVFRTSKEIRDRLQIPESGRCSPAGLSRASLLGSTESLRKSLQMEMDSIRAEQLEESVGRTLSGYISLKADLKGDLEWLSTQQEQLDEACSEVEPLTVLVMGSWGALEKMKGSRDDAREYTKRKEELNKRLLILKIQVVCVKLSHISLVIKQLQELANTDARLQTPSEVSFAGYEEWIENNQQIFQLQSKMLEIEAEKVRLYKEFCVQHRARAQTATSKHSFTSQLEMQFGREPEVEFTQHRLQEMIGDDADTTHITYLDNILSVSENNLSFEACKIKSYIRECWDVSVIDDNFPTGVHPDRYQEFVGSLCQYIVDKHSVGRRRLTYDVVFARLEHHLLPAISPLLTKYICRSEEDKQIKQLCGNLQFVTQSQLGIKPSCQDTSAAPYYAAVTALKAISLSLTPTKKTYSIVKAAQAVFKRLNEGAVKEGRRPPGADDFMDVWVYVVLKAAVPNLASSVALLKRYSNPGLAFSEAGYYLASLEFATQYILRMNEQDFTSDEGLLSTNLVVCEPTRFTLLTANEDDFIETVSSSAWLEGYQLYAVKEWQLDPTRFYSTLLVPVDNPEAKVKVSVIRFNDPTWGRSPQIRFLEKTFLTPEKAHPGLFATRTLLGLAVTADLKNIVENLTLIHLPSGDYDEFAPLIYRFCGLERLCLTSNDDDLAREHHVINNVSVVENKVSPNDEAIQSGCAEKKLRMSNNQNQPLLYLSLDCINREVTKSLQRLCSRYGFLKPHHKALEFLVGSTASLLQDLGYFSVLLEADGVYSDLLLKAVRCFQKDYNSRLSDSSNSRRLVETGCVTVATWRALQDSLQRVVAKLHHLGFVYSGDALSRDPAEHKRFRHFVADCQAALNINVVFPGTLGKNTLAEIEARLNESSWSYK